MVPPPRIDVAECALRIVSRPRRGSWTVVVADDDDAVAAQLAIEVGTLEERPPRNVTWGGLSQLIRALRQPDEDTVVVTGFGAVSDDQWGALDLARSELQRNGQVVLVITPEAASAFGRSAPHLLSWIGGDVWSVDLNEERRRDVAASEERLATLRREHHMTDEEVVRRARDGTLPAEPEFVEWLALLGRGDLLAPR